MELCATGSHRAGPGLVPLHLNSVTQFAAFSGPSNGLRQGRDGATECERGETRMHLSGHRAIRVLAVFLVLALGIAALLPLTARAARQVTGVVSTCGTITPFVSGAVVSLIDANGISPTLTTSTNGAGVYTFTPPSGSYTVSVTRTGYYGNATTVPKRFDGSTTTRIDLCLVVQPTPAKVLK